MSQPQLPASQPPLQNYPRREERPFYLGWAIIIADIALLTVFIWVLFIRVGGGDIRFNMFKSKSEQVVDALKDAGLKIDSTSVYTKEQYLKDVNQGIAIAGNFDGLKFAASSVNAQGGVISLAEDSDYARLRGLAQLASVFSGGTDSSGKTIVTAYKDKDKMILFIVGNFSKEESAKYEAAFSRA